MDWILLETLDSLNSKREKKLFPRIWTADQQLEQIKEKLADYNLTKRFISSFNIIVNKGKFYCLFISR